MKLKLGFKHKPFYIFLIATLVAIAYLIYIDIEEILERRLGHYTFLSQKSWLSDRQAITYCTCTAILALVFVLLTFYKLYQKDKKTVKILCILTWVYIIATIILEGTILAEPIY
jgi:hypothetical protein